MKQLQLSFWKDRSWFLICLLHVFWLDINASCIPVFFNIIYKVLVVCVYEILSSTFDNLKVNKTVNEDPCEFKIFFACKLIWVSYLDLFYKSTALGRWLSLEDQSIIKEFRVFLNDNKDVLYETTTIKLWKANSWFLICLLHVFWLDINSWCIPIFFNFIHKVLVVCVYEILSSTCYFFCTIKFNENAGK